MTGINIAELVNASHELRIQPPVTLSKTNVHGVMAGSDGLYYTVGLPLDFPTKRLAEDYSRLSNRTAQALADAQDALWSEAVAATAALDETEQTLNSILAVLGGQHD